MKNVFWVFMVSFIVQDVACDDSILSKFHQNTYKLKDVRMQLMNYDHELFRTFKMKAFKYNRTTTAHNLTVLFNDNAKDDLEIVVQARKFLSNEYRYFPLRFQVNLKKAVDSNIVGLGDIKKCGNFTTFYFYKDVIYHFCNFVIDETRFPPLVPNGKYKVEITFLFFNKEVLWMDLYCEIYIPIKYPK